MQAGLDKRDRRRGFGKKIFKKNTCHTHTVTTTHNQKGNKRKKDTEDRKPRLFCVFGPSYNISFHFKCPLIIV